MPCACGKRSSTLWEVDFKNGTPKQRYDSLAGAHAALKSAGLDPRLASVRAVAK